MGNIQNKTIFLCSRQKLCKYLGKKKFIRKKKKIIVQNNSFGIKIGKSTIKKNEIFLLLFKLLIINYRFNFQLHKTNVNHSIVGFTLYNLTFVSFMTDNVSDSILSFLTITFHYSRNFASNSLKLYFLFHQRFVVNFTILIH